MLGYSSPNVWNAWVLSLKMIWSGTAEAWARTGHSENQGTSLSKGFSPVPQIPVPKISLSRAILCWLSFLLHFVDNQMVEFCIFSLNGVNQSALWDVVPPKPLLNFTRRKPKLNYQTMGVAFDDVPIEYSHLHDFHVKFRSRKPNHQDFPIGHSEGPLLRMACIF